MAVFKFPSQTYAPSTPNLFEIVATPYDAYRTFYFDGTPSRIQTGCTYPASANSATNNFIFSDCQVDYHHYWYFTDSTFNHFSPVKYTAEESIQCAFDFTTPCYVEVILPISATLGSQLEGLSSSTTGYIQNAAEGTIVAVLDDLVGTGVGVVSDPAIGQFNSQLGELLPQIDGWNSDNGVMTGIVGNVSMSASGFNANNGELNVGAGELVMNASGLFTPREGVLISTVGELSMISNGYVDPYAYMNNNLQGLSMTATGIGGVEGQIGTVVGELLMTATGSNPVRAQMNISLQGLQPQITGNHFENQGVMTATLDDFVVVQGRAVIAEPRDSGSIKKSICTTSELAGQLNKATCNPHSATISVNDDTVCAPAGRAEPVLVQTCNPHSATIPVNDEPVCSPVDPALPVLVQTCNPHSTTIPVNDDPVCSPVDPALPVLVQTCNPHSTTIPVNDEPVCSPVDPALPVLVQWCDPKEILFDLRRRWCDPKEPTEPLPFGQSVWIDPVIDPPDPDPPTDGTTHTIPEEEEYIVNNNAAMTLPNGDGIGVSSVNLTLDAESHSWGFTANLLRRSERNLIKPHEDGTPRIVHIHINDYIWHCVVEKITTNRTFNSNAISVSGRSISALLAYPYTPRNSMTFGSVNTNQQIVESMLPVGWTMNWNMPVWNIPENVYSHQNKSPIEAILELVHMCGGVLIPHRDSQEFTVRPRYPVLPWDFNSVNPDVIVPDSVILAATEEPTAKHGSNGVHIHGEGDAGKQALVRRTGTAGDRLSSTQSNVMMVESTGIRSLGSRVIAGDYPQPLIRSVDTWMTDSTGDIPLFVMGQLVRIDIDNGDVKGIIAAQSVSTNLVNDVTEVSQSFTIGESTNNIASLFEELVPAQPLQVCTLTANLGKNAIVTLVDGGSVQVLGNGTVGQKYYIKGKELRAQAPQFNQLPDVVV